MKQCEKNFSLCIMSAALVAALSFSSTAMAADSDGDGLDDSIERMYGWNPYDANSPGETDTDKDGLTDLTEYKAFTNMYDPNNPVDKGDTDDDGDTLPKGLEVFLMGTNPDKADSDCDGVDDNLDANPVDGSCAPNPGADMTDDITIDSDPADGQTFSIGVPVELVYTVDYEGSPSISTSDIDDDSTYMTWEVSALGNSNLGYVSLDITTGQLTFNEGVNKDDQFTVKASVNEYPDVFDEIIVVAGSGIPDGDSEITIEGNPNDGRDFPKGEAIPLIYTVDYTDGNPISTDGIDDSDTMAWTVSPSEDVTLDVDAGTLVFGEGFSVGSSATVTATLNGYPAITDTIEVVAAEAIIPTVLTIVASKHASEPNTNGRFTLTATPAFDVATVVNLNITGTAINGTDYTAIPSSFTFPAGSSSETIDVIVKDDTLEEPTETVITTLVASEDYELSTSPAATVNIEDQVYGQVGCEGLNLNGNTRIFSGGNTTPVVVFKCLDPAATAENLAGDQRPDHLWGSFKRNSGTIGSFDYGSSAGTVYLTDSNRRDVDLSATIRGNTARIRSGIFSTLPGGANQCTFNNNAIECGSAE
ncbi:hypothetical protein HQQ94_13230 [Shewanella sp. VB17]|uniref:Calx-beta domain-containing protein n=1 Tax=Shewanella sp. VB17 TaxID=2739432 RepID=UPI0015641517|nr:hypothetical protein [Shewanella sp. VB17]NRD74181.1 hypothetical protein [Shewanella sp. VB17]